MLIKKLALQATWLWSLFGNHRGLCAVPWPYQWYGVLGVTLGFYFHSSFCYKLCLGYLLVVSGIEMFMGCAPVCLMSISEGLCAGKVSAYLGKRINSSLLSKIFNGIGWEGCETQRAIIGWTLLFIVQWVIRNKAWFKHNYKTMWCMESPHDISPS